jgi:hypothetical protein
MPAKQNQRPALVQREPNVPTGLLVELAERRHRDDASVFDAEPPLPVFACSVRMLVVPLSGSIRSSSLKSNCLPLASSFAARFAVASISAFDDDGMPHRAIVSSRPPSTLRTIGAG